ncbi:MAG: trypsin-like serine protease [Anaerolineales bacterium]|nr:trypsin-like serine protease [Anaerolineales bacterium]
MNNKSVLVIFGGAAALFFITIACVVLFAAAAFVFPQIATVAVRSSVTENVAIESGIPSASLESLGVLEEEDLSGRPSIEPELFNDGSLEVLFDEVESGVVNIQVLVEQNGAIGQGAGSGFIISDEGYIITNNHVVDGATLVSVFFYDGTEVHADVIGTDADSDLAVLKVEELVEGAHSLPLGDSDNVDEGEWVIAIGNPFGNDNSMTVGIVSAIGRTIPTGVTAFSIPQAIQTDAAINPGNSGGPLLNLHGEVIGVNAQIATDGARANAGVGFAIPANIVRRVAPVLIEEGSYVWPWLGVEGGDVSLAIQEANSLVSQDGAYINNVAQGGPAELAGLRGSTEIREVNSIPVPIGGDIVIEADGKPVEFFSDLLVAVAFKEPGESIRLVVIRDGEPLSLTVELAPRP